LRALPDDRPPADLATAKEDFVGALLDADRGALASTKKLVSDGNDDVDDKRVNQTVQHLPMAPFLPTAG
jgi:hypothetical protein